MKAKRKNSISTIILILFFFVGLSVMLYPSVSDYWNSRAQNHAIENYDQILNNMEGADYRRMLTASKNYNKKLKALPSPLENYDEIEGYENTLDVTGTGIMGYITIPKINVELPIYHGTSDEVLNVAVGHIQGSTLPIGGSGTHCVISAHRGLPSAKLFSDLDQLDIGDTFTITVLDEVLTYSVDKISVVKPDETDNLKISDGRDYVTLVTCTPYGVNTHRLLVRGTRIETASQASVRVSADAVQVEPILVAPAIAAPFLLILFVILMAGGFRKKRNPKDGDSFEKEDF
ncbi:class C sortase [Porcipelethomonas sp.]|uniref:class C sortase n=1 Tax=Porcipelethomonas sp. TaxID=2981675 RepID=UPI003EF34C58